MRRDLGRCRVPGCRNVSWLQVHHVVTRAEGGTHDPARVLLLCASHHRRLHQGFLVIEGTHPCFTFRHADGTPYGDTPVPAAVEVSAAAFSALRHLGFKDGQAKQALDLARARLGSGATATIEALVRAALAALRAAGHEGRASLLPPHVGELREPAPPYGPGGRAAVPPPHVGAARESSPAYRRAAVGRAA